MLIRRRRIAVGREKGRPQEDEEGGLSFFNRRRIVMYWRRYFLSNKESSVCMTRLALSLPLGREDRMLTSGHESRQTGSFYNKILF
ncbi:MAG: hypothetical protein GY820_09455 [Gammaproteobacteria bacterium]|nr:hypothetical protein [Gammaproteobacteria bacterium]